MSEIADLWAAHLEPCSHSGTFSPGSLGKDPKDFSTTPSSEGGGGPHRRRHNISTFEMTSYVRFTPPV